MDRSLKLCLARSLLAGSLVVLLFYVEIQYVYPASTGNPTGFLIILFFLGSCIGLAFEPRLRSCDGGEISPKKTYEQNWFE